MGASNPMEKDPDLAKASSASSKPDLRLHSQSSTDAGDAVRPADADASAPPAGDDKSPKSALKPDASAAIDLHALASAHDTLDEQMRFWAVTIEDTSRSWKRFGEQVAGASAEMVRLREAAARTPELEKDLLRINALHDDVRSRAERLETELTQSRTRENAAIERAAKFEEICEQIKERALEIHNALQVSRANEQKLQDEQTGFRSELVELRRTAQEEAAGRVAAESRAGKLDTRVSDLEKSETEANGRIAQLTQDNTTMSEQVPLLMAESEAWRKQLSASERENTRMLAERRGSAERVSELEAEIKTLREDLASLARARPLSAPSSAAVVVEAAAPAPASADIDDLDLVSSLDRAFGRGDGADDPSSEPNNG